jgi:DNA ligase (NAD+)
VKSIAERREPDLAPFTMIKVCPECGGEIMRPEGDARWRCQNMQCPAQLKRRLQHFASRNAMDIEHLGPETIDKLLDKQLIVGLPDLYSLREEDLLDIEGFEEKSVANLSNSIAKSKKQELWRLIFGLGIRHVGQYAAQLLAVHFRSLEDIAEANTKELTGIKGIGGETAESIVAFFSDPGNREMIQTLLDQGVELTGRMTGPLEGRNFVFTGSMKSISRDEASERVRQLGGRVAGSVSNNTDFIVAGDSPGSKLEKAKKLGIKVLCEEDFKQMVAL